MVLTLLLIKVVRTINKFNSKNKVDKETNYKKNCSVKCIQFTSKRLNRED